MVVYRLTHVYNVGKDKDYEEVRTIGLYSTRKKAKQVMENYMKKRGFKSHIDGFWIDKWVVDKHFEWGDGFISV
ncbi:MAG: hypothetical protein LBV03_05930 [Fusobacteriales bacterium]|jgi:hypothetical protein|nr:hypothetical protein [Fusobacteriales bacterium]